MSEQPVLFARDMRAVQVAAGAFHFPGFLDADQQTQLAQLIMLLGRDAAGFYQPVLRSGHKMRLEMMCLGRHWNARTYTYEFSRSDVDGRPVQPIPPALIDLARRAASAADMAIEPDIVIVNRYAEGGRLGRHQDKDERPETLARGIPVVSISLGDACEFEIGSTKRNDPHRTVVLRSGDAFVFGGPSRLAFHGVRKVMTGNAPPWIGMPGRINLTFRQF